MDKPVKGQKNKNLHKSTKEEFTKNTEINLESRFGILKAKFVNMNTRDILLIILATGLISGISILGWKFLEIEKIKAETQGCISIYQEMEPGDEVDLNWCKIKRAGGHSGGGNTRFHSEPGS